MAKENITSSPAGEFIMFASGYPESKVIKASDRVVEEEIFAVLSPGSGGSRNPGDFPARAALSRVKIIR
ncbi:hypothetical protein AWI14_21345 [Klebsiella aerogenes]|uniref:hypothetical protein n=1 Tax=Klebsiella aerogenes TaxID=548 RepID=UPI000750503F|nr:hypothetical protein [Klebsiella aerogenes]KUQ48824.1 hypothetical protein AWI14_21345 [Klebsiella aerogenes]